MVRRHLGGVFFEDRCSGEHLAGSRACQEDLSQSVEKAYIFISKS